MSYLAKVACGLAVMFMSLVSYGGGNLIINSGFELGGGGYECVKYLRLERNPDMSYEGFELGERDGGRCIRVVNRFGEEFRVLGRELLLKAGNEYTFSVLMKSEVPNMEVDLALLSAVQGESWHKGGKRVKVSGDWQRYSFTFTVPKERKHLYYNPMILCAEEGNSKPGGLWLDELCLVSGKNSTYEPFRGVELSVTPGKSVYVRGRDKAVRLNIEAFNGSGKDLRTKLHLERILDESGNHREVRYGKKELLSSQELMLPAGQSRRVEVEMDLERMGAFVVYPVLGGGLKQRANPAYVTVIGNYERRPLNLDKDFCVSLVHGGGGGFIQAPAYGESWKKSYRTAVGMDEYLGMLGEMGCRLLRDLDYPAPVFRWNQIENEQGKMDFRFTDMAVDAAGRHGIAILPILGENMSRYMPAWCADKFAPARPYRRRMKALEGKTFMPPLELWRRYVAKVAEHYRGRITHYEIVNEPNLYLAPEDYMDMLKVAHEEIKRADSAARVIGFCSTGDLGGVLSEYLERCFKLGGLDYADIVSFHPYSAQNLGSVNAADRQIADLRRLIKNYAGDREKPLWNTELYYLTGRGKDYLSKGEYAPGNAAQRFLIDLGEGVQQSICVPGETVFRKHLGENFGAAAMITMVYPNANFVTYNALARLFEGAKPVDKVKWGSDAVAYVYEKDGKRIAALWKFSGVKGLTLELKKNRPGFNILDVYGNEMEMPAEKLELTENPYYLIWEGDGKDAITYLRGLKTSADVPVQAGEQVRLLSENDRWYAAVGLRNSTGVELSGKVGIQGKGLTGRTMIDFQISGGTLATVRIPVELSGDGTAGTAEVKLYAEKRLWRFPVEVSALPKVYKVGRRHGQPESLENSTGKDVAEHRAEFSAAHDGGRLSLKILVRDTEASGAGGGRDPWEQDCVELFMDIAPWAMPMKHAGKYNGNIARMFILPYEETGSQLQIKTYGQEWLVRDAVVCKVKLINGGYEVNLGIDMLKAEIRSGTLLGFDIAVDDARGANKATRQLLWNSKGDAYKNRCSFGILELKKTEEEYK